jgi:hypothetical protein
MILFLTNILPCKKLESSSTGLSKFIPSVVISVEFSLSHWYRSKDEFPSN